jgi:hypothetical protein
MSVALTLPIPIGLSLMGMKPSAARPTPAEDQVHRPGNDGNEADIDRQGSDRRIEGRWAWTHR